MGVCKCGLSAQYPECDGTHKEVGNNEILRQSIIQAYKKWEADNPNIV
jgi:CDGSH-type Zn-finger protein